MYGFVELVLKALQITLTDIVLSGDNVGVIALAVRDLPQNKAKQARFLGVSAALIMRILFVLLVSVLFSLKWLHIDLIGGVILLYITFTMVKGEDNKSGPGVKAASGGMLRAVASIVVADISMSLDNVLAIASIARQDGNGALTGQAMALVVFGLLLCVPIIFFGSGVVAKLMKRFPIIIYVCAGLLVYTAMKMIFEDGLVEPFISGISEHFGLVCSALCGIAVVVYGFVSLTRMRKKTAE